MAYIPKSKYVGNHGGRYSDIDGNTKQFTYIDHDRHTSRLKSWDYSRKQHEMTKEEEITAKILAEGINELDEFIEIFDTSLAEKYEFQRYRKGSYVTGTQMENIDYEDLKNLYDRFTIQKETDLKNS